MRFDAQNVFTHTASGSLDTQVITGGTTVASYNALDLGQGADATTPTRNLGAGTPVYLITQLTANPGTGTAPSLNVKFVGATDIAFTSSVVICQTGAIATASLMSAADLLVWGGQFIPLIIPPVKTAYRYYRVEYGLNNADNTFTVYSFLAASIPTPYFVQMYP